MRDIDDYSESSLRSRDLNVRNYRRQENQYGIIEISYDILDRSRGASTGALCGSVGSVVGIIGGIVGTVLFPPALPALVVAGLSAPITTGGGAVVGAMIGTTTSHYKIFSSITGELLGNLKSEAARKANDRGLELCNQNKFKEAEKWFRTASSTSGWYKNNWETTQIAVKAEHLLEEEQFAQAKRQFEEAYNIATAEQLRTILSNCISNVTQKIAEDTARAQQTRRLSNATSESDTVDESEEEENQKEVEYCHRSNNESKAIFNIFNDIGDCMLIERAKRLWEEAWKAENDDKSAEAAQKFRDSHIAFRRACELDPNNNDYKNWMGISSLKIEGNELFNQGIQLQQEGNASMQQSCYSLALQKYREALSKFEEGFNRSNDERFLACIELVQMSITETTSAVETAELTTRRLNPQRNYELHQSHFSLSPF